MKATFIMKALAILTVTSLVHSAPVETQLREVARGDTMFCTHFYQDAHFQGINTMLCDKQEACWPVPSWGVSSIKPEVNSCGSWCYFYKQPGCAGDYIKITTIDSIPDLSHFDYANAGINDPDFGIVTVNWDNIVSSYKCDKRSSCGGVKSRASIDAVVHQSSQIVEHDTAEDTDAALQVNELQVRTSTNLSERGTAEENPYCVRFYEDTFLRGQYAVLCIQFKQCWPAPLQGVSSIAPDPNISAYCQFYSSNDCSGEFRGISNTDTVLDFLHWNDNIASYVCDKKLNHRDDTSVIASAESTDAVLEVKELDPSLILPPPKRAVLDDRAPRPTSDQPGTSSEPIGVSLYQDTEFRGFVLGLASQVNACAMISKTDGSGNNFGLSSVRINTPTVTSNGKLNVAYCSFYKGKNCETDTFAFTLGNFLDAHDLNDVSKLLFKGKDNNVNDNIWSVYCTWNE